MKRKKLLDGQPCLKHIDLSNLIKIYEDCMIGVVMEDDCLIWDSHEKKHGLTNLEPNLNWKFPMNWIRTKSMQAPKQKTFRVDGPAVVAAPRTIEKHYDPVHKVMKIRKTALQHPWSYIVPEGMRKIDKEG